MKFVKTYESFNKLFKNIDYVDITSSKDRISNELSYLHDIKEKPTDLSLYELANEAIKEFTSKIKIFNNIFILWVDKNSRKDNTIAEYVHSSSLAGEPILILYEDSIIKELDDFTDEYEIANEKELIIKETMFHELCHAMVDIDNVYRFKEESNILQFEDEEEFVEDFCRDFYNNKIVPKEILELATLFKNKKFIGVDNDFVKQINY